MKNTSDTTNKAVIAWLFLGCALVFLMVFVGGITRLTGSGLSITKWDLVTGTLPPLSHTDWMAQFELYQQSPQYIKANFHFTLEDFKSIYWWEYIHRLIGRIIGIIFLIPFIYFYFKKMLYPKLTRQLLIIFCLGALQGIIGWYMVASGLINNPRVSHYRLALHLMTAFLTCAYIFHVVLQEMFKRETIHYKQKLNGFRMLAWISFFLLLIQITYGAFVAGLRAGYVYNTWPLMGNEWISESVLAGVNNIGISAFIELPSNVQFVHRWLAFIVLAFVVVLYTKTRTDADRKMQLAGHCMISLFVIQILLGIFTLLWAVPVWMGVIHQAFAFLLLLNLTFILHRLQFQNRLLPSIT